MSIFAQTDRPPIKPIEWVGSAHEDLRAMPDEVQHVFGYALHQAQIGKHHAAAKRLKGDLRGLIEIVKDFDGNTYRAMYTAKLAGVIYVLHVFQKRSTHGVATPKREIAVTIGRWQRAKAHYAAYYEGRNY
jgi:phage-related protein